MMPSNRALAGSLGAIVGLVLAYYLPLIWWIGAPVGATVGWVLLSWQEIVHNAPAAARGAQTGMEALPWLWQRRLKTTAWTLFAMTFFAACAMFFTPLPFLIFVGLAQIMALLVLFTRAAIMPNEEGMIWNLSPREVRKREITALAAASPGIGTGFLVIIALFFLMKGLWWTLVHMPMLIAELATFTPRFFVILYRLTNTHERVVVAMDIFIVVIVIYVLFVQMNGWELGPTLIAGGIIGGLLGHFHYQVASRFVTPLFSR